MTPEDITFDRCFSEGWSAFQSRIGLSIGAYVVFNVMMRLILRVPIAGPIYTTLGMFPFYGGYYLLFLGIAKRPDPQIDDLFAGFSSVRTWARWLGLGWLVGLYVLLTSLVCAVVPGISILVAYVRLGAHSWGFIAVAVIASLVFALAVGAIAIRWTFVYYLGAEGATVTEAIAASTEWTEGLRWRLLWIYIVIGLLGIAGALACGVGLIFTLPLAECCSAALYLDVKQLRTQQPSAAPLQNIAGEDFAPE